MAYNNNNNFSARVLRNALGHDVQGIKGKLAIRIRQKLASYTNGEIQNEGGESVDVPLKEKPKKEVKKTSSDDPDEIEEELRIGYTPETFTGGCISFVLNTALAFYLISRCTAILSDREHSFQSYSLF